MSDPHRKNPQDDRLLSLAIQLGSDHQAVRAFSQMDLSDAERIELQRLHNALGFIAQVKVGQVKVGHVKVGQAEAGQVEAGGGLSGIPSAVDSSAGFQSDPIATHPPVAASDTVGIELDTHPSQPSLPLMDSFTIDPLAIEANAIDKNAVGTGATIASDRYQLVKSIGRGGFADVYLANDQQLGRCVALKLLRHSDHQSEDSSLRFQREARAVATLNHPNIVPIYETGQIQGRDYIASAFCEGGTLQQWLSDRPAPLDQALAVAIMLPLSEAVEHAHQRGIVHRDLKPANIFLATAYSEKTGDHLGAARTSTRQSVFPTQLRIGDFGLARQLNPTQSLATADGAIVGTPAYMSPEQASGSNQITAATDIFSLGTIFFELLTGRLPFQGDNNIDLLLTITQKEPPRPRHLNPKVDRDLEAICLKCLQKSPKDRYSSSFEFMEDLRLWQTGHAVKARRIQWWDQAFLWTRRNRWQTAAIVTISAVMFFALYQWYQAGLQSARANRHFELSREVVEKMSSEVATDKKLPPEYRQQFLDYAVGLHVKLLAEEPDDAHLALQTAKSHWLYANLMHDLADIDAALVSVDRAEDILRQYPNDPLFHSFAQLLAETKLQIGVTAGEGAVAEDAAETLDKQSDLTIEEDARRHFSLATMKMSQGGEDNLRIAVQQFHAADILFAQVASPLVLPHRARNYLFWGRAQTQLGNTDQARSLLNQAVAIWQAIVDTHPDNEAIVEDLGKGYYSLAQLEMSQLQQAGLPTAADSESLENAREAFASAFQIFGRYRELNPLRSRAYGLQVLALKIACDLEFAQEDLERLMELKRTFQELLPEIPESITEYKFIQQDFAKVCLAELMLMAKMNSPGFDEAKAKCRQSIEAQMQQYPNEEKLQSLLEELERMKQD